MMSNLRRLGLAMVAIALVAGATGNALAGSVNLDPYSAAPGPVLNAGWAYDQVNAAATNSIDSPYLYTLTGPAVFSITDQFTAGDTYSLYDFGVLIMKTTFNGPQKSLLPIGDPLGDAGWTNGAYSHGSVLLAAGAHDLTVQGDGGGGFPAGFYNRIDSVATPEPATLVGAALAVVAGLAALRRRKTA